MDALRRRLHNPCVCDNARADRNYRLAARRAYFAKVAHARQEWLRKLDEESKAWIPEDKIDEVRAHGVHSVLSHNTMLTRRRGCR